ncbi:iron-sulfur cluster assembly scaffold protein [Candidatus Woesearchaeota archaeon]|nr:iron-sulfur cluster assembly scaffold protein [Candidatus Woesearchaeota archaeon]
MSDSNIYSKRVMEYFKHPKFVGEIKNPDGHGKKGNVSCGDVMEVFIKVEKNKIKDIKFKTYGCVAAISSSEALCRLAKGKTLEQAEKINDKDIAEHLGKLPAIKHHCSILGSETLEEAIKDYRKKHKK